MTNRLFPIFNSYDSQAIAQSFGLFVDVIAQR